MALINEISGQRFLRALIALLRFGIGIIATIASSSAAGLAVRLVARYRTYLTSMRASRPFWLPQ